MNLSPDPGAPLDISYLPAVHDEIFQVYPGISIQGKQFLNFSATVKFCGQFIILKEKKRASCL